ncbi:MAG: polyamine aminopropyltransferase [Acidobacteriota bacterium]|nr:polyamine aminopropyltransferase [Acidobacteriota bacterium]
MEKKEESFARSRAVIYLMTFIMGGCGIAYEYTFSKISSDLLGNSAHQWAITIGLMMLFMGIGSDLQKHFKDKHLFDKFLFFEILLGLIGGFGSVAMLFTFGYFRDHYVLLQYSVTIAVGFLIGLEIPILTRINERYAPELKVNLGGVLRMDYVGAFLGAVSWVFILPKFFTLTQMSFVLGLFNLVTALVALIWFRRLAHRKILAFCVTIASIGALFVGLLKAPQWTVDAEQALYMDRIIYSNTTRYQHIVLTKAPSGDLFCYINGNTQFSSFDEHIYHELLVHPAMIIAQQRKRVLVLGGGDGLAVREILKYPDVEEVTLVDLDPGMTSLAMNQEDLAALNNGSLRHAKVKILENNALVDAPDAKATVFTPDRTRLFHDQYHPVAEVNLVNLDAGKFVEQISGTYDLIIIDFPDPNNMELSKLYSLSFYRLVHDKLARDGILVLQSTSPVHSREAFLCIGRTLTAADFNVLPYRDNVPTFGEWGFWIARRTDSGFTDLKGDLQAIDAIPVPVRYTTPEIIDASLVFGLGQLDTPNDEINTILNNVVYRFYEGGLR